MNKYPPRHHQETDFAKIVDTIKTFPFATLISTYGDQLFVTHVPLIYYPKFGENGKLVGHMDRNNPHCSYLDKCQIKAVFHGPNSYISPTDYLTPQLPTWNHITVHISGKSKVIESISEVKKSIIRMTDFLETGDNPFVLTEDNTRMNQIINFIVGFEIEITAWEGKFKLSQDKGEEDKHAAKLKLISNSTKGNEAFIETILDRESINVK